MNIKYFIILPLILLTSQLTYNMGVQRIEPDEKILAMLKPIAKPTFGDSLPNIDALQKPNRRFIAKMDSFGLIRYFSLKNNKDAQHILQGARNGGGWDPEFFYFDTEESVVSITKIAPNIIVLSDN